MTAITSRCDFGRVGGKIALAKHGDRTWGVKRKSREQMASQTERTAMNGALAISQITEGKVSCHELQHVQSV